MNRATGLECQACSRSNYNEGSSPALPHPRWGVETLRKTVAAMAEALSPVRHQVQANKLRFLLDQAAATVGPRRVQLVVGRDGIMLPICDFAKYKEAATATVSVYDRWGKRDG